MSELLTCEGLTKHYGAKTALDGVDPVSYTHLTLPTKLEV